MVTPLGEARDVHDFFPELAKRIGGFKTPSRKFEVRSLFVESVEKNLDCSELINRSGSKAANRPSQHAGHDTKIDQMPIWFQPVEHESLADDEMIMTSFKWNVHNHGRTMNLKWLAEIVHSNPAWLNPMTAEKSGLADGDWIEVTSYHSLMLQESAAHLHRETESVRGRKVAGQMRVPIVIMPGIHPSVIAMSNSCGHWQYSSVAQAKERRRCSIKAWRA